MRFVVTADDTTGALETAAACADLGWAATVRVSDDDDGEDATDAPATVAVLDLRSRHLPADEAAARVRGPALTAGFRCHKIDSTLRGNWAAEVEAIAHAGRPVLVVPAFPAAGRTCVDGCVLVDGVPVHETAFGHDPRSPVTSSRPVERLHGAVGAADLAAVRTAFADGRRIVVADAVTDDDLDRWAGVAVDHPEVVLVGPAAVATSFAARLSPDLPAPTALERLVGEVLVVSASRHPAAAAQFERLRACGVAIVRPPDDADPADPDGVLSDLAAAALARLAAESTIRTVVVVGGDSAAAVLGRAAVHVEGALGVGIAVGRTVLAGREVRLVTKPGGFGGADTLVDVLQDVLPGWLPR